MSTHSPGPWEAVDKRPDGFTGYSIFQGGQFIAHVGDTDRATPVEDNARLIAAAPELLEALEDLVSLCEAVLPRTEHITDAELFDARSAIAKATGGKK